MNQPIRASALLRAAITAIVKASKEPMVFHEFVTHPAIVALSVSEPTISQMVYEMSKIRARKLPELRKVRVFRRDFPNSKWGYEDPTRQTVSIAPPVKPPNLQELPGDLKIDVSKTTGRLRIEYRGLTLEIGIC